MTIAISTIILLVASAISIQSILAFRYASKRLQEAISERKRAQGLYELAEIIKRQEIEYFLNSERLKP